MSLVRATSSELAKQFTTSIWWILAVVLAAYAGMCAAGLGAVFGANSEGGLRGGAGATDPTALLYSLANAIGYVFPLLIGTLLVTGEFRHKTLTLTFLAIPQRATVLGGKLIAGAVMGLVYGVIGVVFVVGPAAAMLAVFGHDPALGSGNTWALIARTLIAYVLWVLIGIGIGIVVRNQVAAVVIVLAFTQFVEPLLRLAGSLVEQLASVTHYLPGAAGDALVGASIFGSTSAEGALAWWGGGLVLLGYAAVLLAVGYVTSWRRDVA